MAAIASPQPGAAAGDDPQDPFVSTPAAVNHLRYSHFDSQLLNMGPGASPDQARRALEAHLAETDRRMEEAGKLGTALVHQRKQLTERLKEVEQLQSQGELTPDLRKKLVDIEKDYNEVARESARAFLPKPRIPSNESGSPFAPEGKGGRRSVSPSKFESQATGSPTKLSVPNRKIRNQPNRIHDIEFAAEISTSLISQVRNLQALLAEREEELRDVKFERSKLELEAEGFQQRMKTLDESEHRYKDENWTLETQIHELLAEKKEAAEREKKLTQSLNLLQADKNTTQRELDEIKMTHAKLVDEHAAAVKQHDIELGTVKRNMVMAETERSTMQRKIEDLTSQNQELAKAFSVQRGRTLEREAALRLSDEDFDASQDNMTPEHSPPPSPTKATPRHSMLESETLKTSLLHAQRTIQSLRTNVHREKTEKLELKRMLQDARDELEKARAEPSASTTRTTRHRSKTNSREFKKPPKLNQLGSFRSTRSEIYMDDPNWEDQAEDGSPSRSLRASSVDLMPSVEESGSEHFETAHETSDAAFETAYDERATETEDFQTGVEDMSDGDGGDTETESPSRGGARIRRPASLALRDPRDRMSFQSTASTSNDEDYTLTDLKTPTFPDQNVRLRLSRQALPRRARETSEEPTLESSPISFPSSSVGGTPQALGQSLFAELGDLDGSDDDSIGGTPSRSIRSTTPASTARRVSPRSTTPASTARRVSPPPDVPPLPRVVMVDSGMMTDPVDFAASPTSPDTVVGAFPRLERPLSMDSVIAAPLSLNNPGTSWFESGERDADSDYTRPLSSSTFPYSDSGAQYDPEIDEELSRFPSPPTSPPRLGAVPILAPPGRARDVESPAPPELSMSGIHVEHLEPRSEPEAAPPALSFTPINTQQVEPIKEPAVVPPTLTMASITAEDVEPRSEPEILPPPPPALIVSSIQTQHIEPVAAPEAPVPTLGMSSIQAAQVEPVAEPETPLPAPPALNISSIFAQHVEPVREPEPPVVAAPELSVSSIAAEVVDPVAEPLVAPPALGFSTLHMQNVEPVAEREVDPVVAPAVVAVPRVLPPVNLGISAVQTQLDVEPIAAPEQPLAVPEPLSFSAVQTENVEPRIAEPVHPTLAFSQILGENLEPRAEPEQPLPVLSVSGIATEHVQPVTPVEPEIIVPSLSIGAISSEHVEPISPVEPEVVVPALSMATISSEHVAPVAPFQPPLALAHINSEHVEPISPIEPKVVAPPLSMATISSEHVEPVAPVERKMVIPPLGYSALRTLETEPISPRSPKRNGFILPRDEDRPRTPTDAIFGSFVGRGRDKAPATPIIAEDETRQSPSGSPLSETPESQRPFRELSANSNARPARKRLVATVDQSAQTALTADVIDQIMNMRSKSGRPEYHGHSHSDSFGTSVDSPGTVRIRRSQESIGSVIRHKGKVAEAAVDPEPAYLRRPGSASSNRASLHNAPLPPLPPNHRQAIEAARTGSSSGGQGTIGTMGPPLLPASAYRNMQRPRTPSGGVRPPQSPISVQSAPDGTPTPRAARVESAHGTAEVHSSSRITARSRQSSVSSFTSEINTRFNMHADGMGIGPHGFGPNTDPRMIQAITQTMIGEYLWKYTRKAGRGEMSENRHRRYFWVHPYTRTLYWSDRDPSTAGRSELRAKSVPIEAVRVVTDDNPMPPGLHRKSLIILSPGRSIKFTCTTGQRHETWFNALSYLLLRTDAEGQTDAEEMAGHITSEDVDEFNPQLGRRPVVGTRAATGGATTPHPPPSLSSYNSRTTRAESPALVAQNISLDVPTLTPKRKSSIPAASSSSNHRPSIGTLGRLSGYWKSGTFSSIRSRSANAGLGNTNHSTQGHSIYEASEVHDSAEDLRVMYERQDREADRLENVRACCDGKHDVGTLTRKGGNHHHHHHHHHAPGQQNSAGPSTTPTPASTIRART